MRSLTELIDDDLPITVIDIGAALGERPSYQGLVELGKARIIGFEPDAGECAKLNATYGAPHRFLPYFIGDGAARTFHETAWHLTGSLLEPNAGLNSRFHQLAEPTRLVARHPVQTTRLDDVPDIADVDFIKLDIQGAELMVLQHARHALGEALMVQCEVEFVQLYADQPLFSDVDLAMRAAGYQFHTFLGFGQRAFKPLIKANKPNSGFRQLIWSDAVYVRDWMDLDAITLPKLKKYAVLAHDVMASYDLCHMLVDEIDRRQGSRLAERYRDGLQSIGAPVQFVGE